MNRLFLFYLLSFSLFILLSCDTDDVQEISPDAGARLGISADAQSILESNGSTRINFILSESSDVPVNVQLSISGSASSDSNDYSLSATSLSISPGSLTDFITLTAIDDTLKEGNETVEIMISSIEGANIEGSGMITITIEDDDVPQQIQIIVNEILYDPSNNGLDGDANGDGVYAQNEDEFIEFANLSSQDVDISGFKIFDTEGLTAGTPQHVFPPNTVIPAGKVIVVFGGGSPSGSFGGAIVQTSTSGDMNLNNAGDIMTLTDTADAVIVTFDIEPLSNNPNESYTRNPDLTGEFEQHGANTNVLFSPGTKIDGNPF